MGFWCGVLRVISFWMAGCSSDDPEVTFPLAATSPMCSTSPTTRVTRQILVEIPDPDPLDPDGGRRRRPRFETVIEEVPNPNAASCTGPGAAPPGNGVVNNSITTAANNAMIAGAATLTAGALVSKSPGVSTRPKDPEEKKEAPKNVAETQMALAKPGGSLALEKEKKDGSASEINGLAGGFGNSNLDTGRGGGNSPSNPLNGGGGGRSLSGDIKTSPSAETKTATNVKTAAEDTAYSSGGGGGGGGGGPAGGSAGGNGESYFGSNGDGSATGAQDSIAFLKEMPDVPAMSSADPEDYFNRINPAMTIFEVVSNGYRKKTMKWPLRLPASAEAKAPEEKIEAPKLDGVK